MNHESAREMTINALVKRIYAGDPAAARELCSLVDEGDDAELQRLAAAAVVGLLMEEDEEDEGARGGD